MVHKKLSKGSWMFPHESNFRSMIITAKKLKAKRKRN